MIMEAKTNLVSTRASDTPPKKIPNSFQSSDPCCHHTEQSIRPFSLLNKSIFKFSKFSKILKPKLLVFFILFSQVLEIDSIMTFPEKGVYSLFPHEDLHTGRSIRFEDDPPALADPQKEKYLDRRPSPHHQSRDRGRNDETFFSRDRDRDRDGNRDRDRDRSPPRDPFIVDILRPSTGPSRGPEPPGGGSDESVRKATTNQFERPYYRQRGGYRDRDRDLSDGISYYNNNHRSPRIFFTDEERRVYGYANKFYHQEPPRPLVSTEEDDPSRETNLIRPSPIDFSRGGGGSSNEADRGRRFQLSYLPEAKLPPRAKERDLREDEDEDENQPRIHLFTTQNLDKYGITSNSNENNNKVHQPPHYYHPDGPVTIDLPGPDAFLNHEEYLTFHTKIALETLNNEKKKLEDVSRKVLFSPSARPAAGGAGGHGSGHGHVSNVKPSYKPLPPPKYNPGTKLPPTTILRPISNPVPGQGPVPVQPTFSKEVTVTDPTGTALASASQSNEDSDNNSLGLGIGTTTPDESGIETGTETRIGTGSGTEAPQVVPKRPPPQIYKNANGGGGSGQDRLSPSFSHPGVGVNGQVQGQGQGSRSNVPIFNKTTIDLGKDPENPLFLGDTAGSNVKVTSFHLPTTVPSSTNKDDESAQTPPTSSGLRSTNNDNNNQNFDLGFQPVFPFHLQAIERPKDVIIEYGNDPTNYYSTNVTRTGLIKFPGTDQLKNQSQNQNQNENQNLNHNQNNDRRIGKDFTPSSIDQTKITDADSNLNPSPHPTNDYYQHIHLYNYRPNLQHKNKFHSIRPNYEPTDDDQTYFNLPPNAKVIITAIPGKTSTVDIDLIDPADLISFTSEGDSDTEEPSIVTNEVLTTTKKPNKNKNVSNHHQTISRTTTTTIKTKIKTTTRTSTSTSKAPKPKPKQKPGHSLNENQIQNHNSTSILDANLNSNLPLNSSDKIQIENTNENEIPNQLQNPSNIKNETTNEIPQQTTEDVEYKIINSSRCHGPNCTSESSLLTVTETESETEPDSKTTDAGSKTTNEIPIYVSNLPPNSTQLLNKRDSTIYRVVTTVTGTGTGAGPGAPLFNFENSDESTTIDAGGSPLVFVDDSEIDGYYTNAFYGNGTGTGVGIEPKYDPSSKNFPPPYNKMMIYVTRVRNPGGRRNGTETEPGTGTEKENGLSSLPKISTMQTFIYNFTGNGKFSNSGENKTAATFTVTERPSPAGISKNQGNEKNDSSSASVNYVPNSATNVNVVNNNKHNNNNIANNEIVTTILGQAEIDGQNPEENETEPPPPLPLPQANTFQRPPAGNSNSGKENNVISLTHHGINSGVVAKVHAHISNCPRLFGSVEIICDVHIKERHGDPNPQLSVGWVRKFYNETTPDQLVALNKTLAYEEDFHDRFNVTLAPGISPMLRSVLIIRQVTAPDCGNYQCEVFDGVSAHKSETLLFLCH